MGRRILIISSSETFTVRGLEMKLKSIGTETVFSAPRLNEIEPLCDSADLIILYTDDSVGKTPETLVYIKDRTIARDKKIIVIGASAEYEVITGFIPDENIYRFYERPLNMEKFLDDIEKFFANEANADKRKSILIVDDDVSYMTMIMDWLKNTYRVSLANSGMQAITWLAKNQADLILLDYEMPITSGPQVLEMIKSDASTSHIPVFFLTGKGDKESIMKVLSLKPAGYLLKSIDRKGLHDTLHEFFSKQMTKKI